MPRRSWAGWVAGALLLALAACTPESDAESPGRQTGCGPVAYDDIAGTPPRHVDGPVDPFANDHALCAGRWLPRTGTAFVPQGLVVRGRTAWVSGYDHGRVGYKYCRVMRLDLRTGRRLGERARVDGRIGTRAPVGCRHGGGLSSDRHGLWLTEKRRLWLLDPHTLETRRAWAIVLPVWGSSILHDGEGRLGLVGYDPDRHTTLHWFDPDDLLAPGVIEVRQRDAVDRLPAPAQAQGAFWGDPRSHRPDRARVWFVRSTTRCGELTSGRHRVGFLPGAEGASYAGRRLWVLSESTAAPYYRKGGRPVVPQLARFDLRRLADWRAPDCTV
jgi:hypothetical protein